MKTPFVAGLKPPIRNFGSQNGMAGKFGAEHHQSIPVVGVDRAGSEIRFASMSDAERAGFGGSKISLCCSGRRNTHKGYAWRPLPLPPEEGKAK